MTVPAGPRPEVQKVGPDIYLIGADHHRLMNWATQQTERTGIPTSVRSVVPLAPGYAWLSNVLNEDAALNVRRPRFRACQQEIPHLEVEGPDVVTMDVAAAGSGRVLAGTFRGQLGGIPAEGHSGFIAQWNHRGAPRGHWVITSPGELEAGVHSIDTAGQGGMSAAGMACQGNPGHCVLLLRDHRGEEWPMDLGPSPGRGLGYLLDVKAGAPPSLRGIARPLCEHEHCTLNLSIARSVGALRYVVVNHSGGFEWVPVDAGEPQPPIPMGHEGRRGATLLIVSEGGRFLHALPFPSDEHFGIDHLTVQSQGEHQRVLFAGRFRGQLPHLLGDRHAPRETGYVAEVGLRTDGHHAVDVMESRILVTAISEGVHYHRVDVAEAGHIDFVGHSQDDTALMADHDAVDSAGTGGMQTFAARLFPDGSLRLLNRTEHGAIEHRSRGIVSLHHDQFMTSTHAEEAVQRTGMIAGQNEQGDLWTRRLTGDDNATVTLSRPRELSKTSVLLGGHISASPMDLPTEIVTDAIALDRTYPLGNPQSRIWVTALRWRTSGAECDHGECTWVCGDGLLGGEELCDDGNDLDGDGCSAACRVEAGFRCDSPGRSCTALCGDGIRVTAEGCDDGNRLPGDGCDVRCRIEPGASCSDESPSVCEIIPRCADTGGVAPCYDERTHRCSPAELCPPRQPGVLTQGIDVCNGPNCVGNACRPNMAGNTRPCGLEIGACRAGIEVCDGFEFGRCQGTVGPQVEICNGIDDDCDGVTDESIEPLTCGRGQCTRTVLGCRDGLPTRCEPGPSMDEVCNLEDDDCDGEIDEGLDLPLRCGEGQCAAEVSACANGVPGECVPGPAGLETCNAMDDDCDGHVDEFIPISGLGACA